MPTQLCSVRRQFICIGGSSSAVYVWYVLKNLNAFPLFIQTEYRNLLKTDVAGVWEAPRVEEVNYFYSSSYTWYYFFIWHNSLKWARVSSFTKFLDHTQRRIIVGRTPLDEWLARRRDLYLTTHNSHNRHISKPPGGIRTHSLSRRAAADLHLRPRGHGDRHMVFLRS